MNIIEIVVHHLKHVMSKSETDALDLKADIRSDYGITSLQLVTAMVAICEASKVDIMSISADQVNKLNNTLDIIDLIETKSNVHA